jgi:hypothetical protein
MPDDNGDGRPRDERVERIVAVVRAKVAEARAEYGDPRLTVDAVEPPPPKPWKPLSERTTDEILAEAIAERDATLRKAAELQAEIELRKLDIAAADRRRRGVELLQ